MGLELAGRARVAPRDGSVTEGVAKILLETDDLIVRGPVRVKIPRADIREVTARGETVTVRHAGGVLSLMLGGVAQKFADKLLAPPKTRLEKMEIVGGAAVVVLNFPDKTFVAELKALGVRVSTRATTESNLIVLGVQKTGDLPRIAAAARSLAPAGALWVVHPKGTAGVKDTDIFGHAARAGLTYTKVARFSETHTAEKLVIPKVRRKTAVSG
jgi:hypothetical protein